MGPLIMNPGDESRQWVYCLTMRTTSCWLDYNNSRDILFSHLVESTVAVAVTVPLSRRPIEDPLWVVVGGLRMKCRASPICPPGIVE